MIAKKKLMKYFEKTALNVSKARQLAKQVGLIPHPESQWKWALRKLRAIPAKNQPLMLEGKKLRIAKETNLNLLSNQEMQKIRSASRKTRLQQEIGLDESGKIVKGTGSEINITNPGSLKAHTHPGGSKFLIKKISKDPKLYHKKELLREFDDVLVASPSGKDYAVPNVNRKLLKRTGKLGDEISELLENRDTLKKKLLWNPIIHLTSTGKSIKKRIKQIDKKWMNVSKEQYKIEKKIKFPEYAADAQILSNIKKPHVIISGKTTGIHKYRSKIPYGFRSIYFKGGLNQ